MARIGDSGAFRAFLPLSSPLATRGASLTLLMGPLSILRMPPRFFLPLSRRSYIHFAC